VKTIGITEFKKFVTSASAAKLKDMQSVEITADGEPVAILVIGAREAMRDMIKGYAGQSDAGRGK